MNNKGLLSALRLSPATLVAFVVGLLVGWIVLGWWVWPVEWKDAAPAHLHPTYQEDYLRMAIDSYQVNRNPGLARQRFEALGDKGPQLLAEIQARPGPQDPKAIQAFALVVSEQAPMGETPAPPGMPAGKQKAFLLMVVCLVLTAGVVVAGLVLFLMRRKRSEAKARKSRKEERFQAAVQAAETRPGEEALSHYVTTYEFGNDYFDESFAVETEAGEFLGECGVNLAEALGTGTPREAAAFEVWLFDKGDIQTVTKVLVPPALPEHLLERVRNRGEVVRIEGPGQVIDLETTNLRAQVRIRDVQFDQSERGQYVKSLSVEFLVWQKAGEAAAPGSGEMPLAG